MTVYNSYYCSVCGGRLGPTDYEEGWECDTCSNASYDRCANCMEAFDPKEEEHLLGDLQFCSDDCVSEYLDDKKETSK